MTSSVRRGVGFGWNAALVAVAAAHAAVLQVPEEYPTVRAAVVASADGDEIVLAAGDYSTDADWNIQFPNWSIAIRGALPGGVRLLGKGSHATAFVGSSSASTTIRLIDLSFVDFQPVFAANGGAAWMSGAGSLVVDGCHFERCGPVSEDVGYGGAVSVYGAVRLEVSRCVFLQNHSPHGGAIGVTDLAEAIVSDSYFRDNRSSVHGGALYSESTGAITVERCAFIANWAGGSGGAIAIVDSDLSVESSLLVANSCEWNGGGIDVYSPGLSEVQVSSCTIMRNYATRGGGVALGSSGQVSRCIVRENCGPETNGRDIHVVGPGLAVECSCLDAEGIAHPEWITHIGGQVWTEPRVCDPHECSVYDGETSWYMLQADSPCLAWNSPCGQLIGAYDLGCEATPTMKESWGALKSRFRPNRKATR